MDPGSLPTPPYSRLYGRVVLPDVTPSGDPHAPRGTITIRPVPPRVTYQDASGQARLVASQTVCQIDSEGYLTSDGHRWVDLVAPGVGVVPSGTWLYRVEIIADSRLDIHTITLTQGQAIDLAHSIAAATVVDPPTAAASAIAAAQSAAASARSASAAAEAARVSSDAAVRALSGAAPTPSGGGGSTPAPSPDAPTRQDLEDLRARVEQIASQAPSGPDLALTTRVTTVEASVEGLRTTITQAQAATQAAQTAVTQATQTATTTEAALAAVRESVAKNGQAISALTGRVDALPAGGSTPAPSPDAPTRQDLEALRAKINALEGAATSGGTPTQRVDMSTTHTYTLAEGVPMQVVLVTKSAAGMATLEHPAGVTWPLGVPSLTSEVGQQVHLIFIRVASGWLGYAAGDLDNIDQVLASLPPMRMVLPKFMDNGWAETGKLAICNTVSDSDGVRTIKVARNVQKKLPDNKRGNSEWWNFLEDVSPEQAAKTKSGDLLLIGANLLALNKPVVVSGKIESENLRINFGIYAVPYNETLATIGVDPNGAYNFIANGAPAVITTVKAASGDSLRLKYDGSKCAAYIMPAGKKTWTMISSLTPKPFGHAETSVQPRINGRDNFTASDWQVAGEVAGEVAA
nr:MAG TPA: hypothetical protein [Caudoviricetes sp.]